MYPSLLDFNNKFAPVWNMVSKDEYLNIIRLFPVMPLIIVSSIMANLAIILVFILQIILALTSYGVTN